MTPQAPGGILQKLMAMRGAMGGQQSQGGPGGPSGANPGQAGAAVASQMSELRNADPDAMKKTLEEIKQKVVAMIPQTAFRMPKVTKHLSRVFDALSSALEEAQKAAATYESVKNMSGGPGGPQGPQPTPPLGISALPGSQSGPPMPDGGGMGGPGGM